VRCLMRRLMALLSVFFLLSPVGGTQGEMSKHKSRHHVRHHEKPKKVLTVTWYQRNGHYVAWAYHGKPGEKMYPGCMTAAHPTLPFGSILKVRRGKAEVTVTVTDRGPMPGTGSDLDLSREAARRLGIVKLGRAKAVVEL